MRTLTRDINDKTGEIVTVMGWVHTRRDHGRLIFIDLRDREGILQVVFTPEKKELLATADHLRSEWVVRVQGIVKKRPKGMQNPDLATGGVEIEATELRILNESKTLPFNIDSDGYDIGEEHRLRYRYLDLRRARLKKNLDLRHRAVLFMRNYLSERGFTEIETPMLTKGTPEGAREYVVPSRLFPGNFYVLPQSPQQFKQLLMVAGFEKYFQFARAFRDEDQRGDRQPEFTQLDLEMSFVSQEEILSLTEDLITKMAEVATPEKIISKKPWPRLTHKECMEKYGTDKPDLRRDTNNPHELAFAWVVDFPLFEKNSAGEIAPTHHPFTAPHPEDVVLLESDPLRARANAYDMVLNGHELASGSIRIHKRELQNTIFKILGLSEEEIEKRFGHMLDAFEFGAPPHGGIAPGLDRLIMILAGESTISEVIAFPKTGSARDLMMNAPADIPKKQLRELHIDIVE